MAPQAFTSFGFLHHEIDRRMRGRHLTARGVEHRLASTLNLTFDSPQPLVVDGEMQTTRHLTIKILPRALRVLVSH